MRNAPERARCGATVPTLLISGRYLFSSFAEFLPETHNELICSSGESSNFNPDSRNVQIPELCPVACIITRARAP